MRKYKTVDVFLDELELEYLLELVERSLNADGPLIGVEVQGVLAEGLAHAQSDDVRQHGTD